MKNFKRLISFALVLVLGASLLSATAFAEEDPTGFGIRDMSYEMAVISVPAMNAVFDAANVLAGAVEVWTALDGSLYTDLPYGDSSRECQKYDLYVPKGLDKNAPQGVLLFIHGGTWTMGEKEHMVWACARYAKLGYIAATMDYDLASQGNDNVAKVTGSKSNADIFDMLEDVSDCIAAIKEKCGELGYKVDALALSGTSAGSHIASLYAYARAEESAIPIKMIFPLTTPVGFYSGTFDNMTDAEVAQYATIVSGVELSENDIANPSAEADAILASISPVANISENSVPTLLGFAGKDTIIGTNQYETIKPVLDAKGVPNEVVWWENSDHTLIADVGAMLEWNSKVEQWLEKYMPHKTTLPFKDVPCDAWYYEGVEYTFNNGLMKGVSEDKFAPDSPMTRAMLITVLYRMAGEPDVSALSEPFDDVNDDMWYRDAVAWGYNEGIIYGFTESRFCPDGNVTRAQLAAMLYRYAGAPVVSGDLNYKDSAAVADWCKDALIWASENSIIQGYDDGTIRPDVTATRAELAVILSRYCQS